MDPNEYFKNIAISHKSIGHTEQKPAYFREYSSSKILFSNSDFLNKMRYVANTCLVSQFNKDGSYFGANSDQFAKENTGTIYLIKKVKDNEIDTAFDATYEIWKDILTKIIKDETDGVFETVDFRYKDSYIYSLGMIADGFYGIAVFISYYDFQDGSCLVYDAEQWK